MTGVKDTKQNSGWILIVEDDKDASDAVSDTLKEAGFRSVQAYTVAEARSKLQRQKFAGVVLDLHLDQGSGEQVLTFIRSVRGVNDHVPVLIVSGFVDPEVIKRIKTQVQGILVKPYGRQALIERLRATLQQGLAEGNASRKSAADLRRA